MIRVIFNYLLIIALLVLSSCDNSHLIVEGSNIPNNRLNDSISISIGDFRIRKPLGGFTLDRHYKINSFRKDSILFEAEVPKMKYFFSQIIPKFKTLYVSFNCYFSPSLVQKYIIFDSIYHIYPDSLKFNLSVKPSMVSD